MIITSCRTETEEKKHFTEIAQLTSIAVKMFHHFFMTKDDVLRMKKKPRKNRAQFIATKISCGKTTENKNNHLNLWQAV